MRPKLHSAQIPDPHGRPRVDKFVMAAHAHAKSKGKRRFQETSDDPGLMDIDKRGRNTGLESVPAIDLLNNVTIWWVGRDEEKFKTFRETTAAQNILHYVKDIKMHPDPQFPKMSFSRVHQKRRIVGDTHRANYTPGIWKQTQFEGASVGCAASHKVVSALGQFETADPCYIGIIEGDIQIFEEAGTIINAAWDAFIRPQKPWVVNWIGDLREPLLDKMKHWRQPLFKGKAASKDIMIWKAPFNDRTKREGARTVDTMHWDQGSNSTSSAPMGKG